MSEITAAIEAGKEFLSLSTTLVKLISDSQTDDEHKESLFQIVQKLQFEASKMNKAFQEELRRMMQEFDENNIDLDLTFEELLSDLSWYQLLAKRNLKASRDKFYNLHRQLANFIDDINAVLVCSGTVQSASEAYLIGLHAKQSLDQFMLKRPSIRETLEELLNYSIMISTKLHNAIPSEKGKPKEA